MTYRPHQLNIAEYEIPKEFTTPDKEGVTLIERISKEVHERWAAERIAEGKAEGKTYEQLLAQYENLIPYDELSDEGKELNRIQTINALRLAGAFGFKVMTVEEAKKVEAAEKNKIKGFFHKLFTKKAKSIHWKAAVERFWKAPYNNEAEPEYGIPLILGLIAQDNTEYDEDSVLKSVDTLLKKEFSRFRLKAARRKTPVYILSPLENELEREVAEHLEEKWDISCIKVCRSAQTSGMYVVTDDPVDYIANSCFALIDIWDGCSASEDNKDAYRCFQAARKTLLETVKPTLETLPNEAYIGDSHPVYNIVLPSPNTKKRLHYKALVRLPHILESGDNWYLLDNEPENDKSEDKQQVENYEKYKKDRYRNNLKAIRKLNKLISRPGIADTEPVYDQLPEPCHGVNKAADAANMRMIRFDTLATAHQKFHKSRIVTAAWCAGAGLVAYAILSDLGDIVPVHSRFGMLMSVVALVTILVSLMCIFLSGRYKFAHIHLRLLSESMRVKTFWNALGLSEHQPDEGMTSKTRTELEFASIAFHGWKVLDDARGFYREENTDIRFADALAHEWLGSQDKRVNNSYSDNKGGQMGYARKTSRRFSKKARRSNFIKYLTSTLAMIFTFVYSVSLILLVAGKLAGAQSEVPEGFFTALFDPSNAEILFESAIMIAISVIPYIGVCSIMYSTTRLYEENVIRYRWLAVQYQKLISQYDNLTAEAEQVKVEKNADGSPNRIKARNELIAINDKKKGILLTAGKMAVAESSEWTTLMISNNVDSPF